MENFKIFGKLNKNKKYKLTKVLCTVAIITSVNPLVCYANENINIDVIDDSTIEIEYDAIKTTTSKEMFIGALNRNSNDEFIYLDSTAGQLKFNKSDISVALLNDIDPTLSAEEIKKEYGKKRSEGFLLGLAFAGAGVAANFLGKSLAKRRNKFY